MNLVIHPKYNITETEIISVVKNFNSTGEMLADGKRNKIKIFKINDAKINVKAFKIPNLINQFVYGYFRPSKAKRSFDYASMLINKGIGTPKPIAYVENKNFFGLKDSYYFCEQLEVDLTFRELIMYTDWPDRELILRQFAQFCFMLHEKGIEFKDHSPGNTLIKKVNDFHYEFYLVDLNRMSFHKQMDFKLRMKNMSKLTPMKDMIEIMSNEYAKLYTQKSEQEIFDLIWFETIEFQKRFYKKQAFKNKYLKSKKGATI